MPRRRRRKKNRIILKLMVLLICLTIAITLIVNKTLSRYESKGISNGEIEVAFYLLNNSTQSMNINLFSMVPRIAPYEKIFTVANNDGDKRTETALEYEIQIITTTNLPLTYKLYINDGTTDIITKTVIEQDANETYFQTLSTAKKSFGYATNETNTYKLVINFPETYKTVEYQNIIESIEIKIDSKQII